MSVSPTSGTGVNGSGQPSSAAGAASGTNLNQNEFLNLLVAQLKYQNPMQPMNSSTFITQLAAFQTVQELQSIQSSLTTLVKDEAQVLAQTKAQPQGTGTQGTGTQGTGTAS